MFRRFGTFDITRAADGEGDKGPAAGTPPPGDAPPTAAPPADAPPPAGDKGAPPADTPPAADKGAPPPKDGEPPVVPAPVAKDGEPPPVEVPKEWKKDAIPAEGLPDDWAERSVKLLPADQQEKARDYLKTRPSIADVLRAGLAAQSRITEVTEAAKGLLKPPTKDSKPEEITAWNKALGIPDDPKEYKFGDPLPEGQTLSPLDEMVQDKARPLLKEAGFNQAQVDTALKVQGVINEVVQQEAKRVAVESAVKAKDNLMVHFGPRAYTSEVENINRYVGEVVGKLADSPDELKDGLNTRLADGTCLGDKPWFVKMLAPIAAQWADDNNLPRGQIEAGIDLEKRQKEIISWSQGTPEQKRMYDTKSVQDELKTIIGRLNRQNARGKAA